MNIKRLATIIQFEPRADLAAPQELIRLGCRVTIFAGAVLGIDEDSGYVIAAFHTPEHAGQFLTAHLKDGGYAAAHLGEYESNVKIKI